MGCKTESDFAIVHHVKTYSKLAFPTIYTNDTDLLVLLSDINCVIKLCNKSGKSIMINPVEFWKYIFGCHISANIIKLLCVLKGTDYNPWNEDSPIHINDFKDILSLLNIQSFKDIDEDILRVKIYEILIKNKGNIYCSQTALALNMYMNELENNIYYLTVINKELIDCNRYVKKLRKNMFVF